METNQVLSSIFPAYLHLVKYSKPESPLLVVPDTQPKDESSFPSDAPVHQFDMEENDKWAQTLRKAAEESIF